MVNVRTSSVVRETLRDGIPNVRISEFVRETLRDDTGAKARVSSILRETLTSLTVPPTPGNIVQAASAGASGTGSQPTTNWPLVPAAGNLLLAFGFVRNQAVPSGVNGWKVYQYVATNNWYLVLYYKYTSGAQVEAVDAFTTYSEWALQFWSIGGVSGKVWKDIQLVTFGLQNGSATSLGAGTITTQAKTNLVLSMFAGQLPNSTDTTSWAGDTNWTQDSSITQSPGNAFAVFNFASGGHQAIAGGNTVTSTVTTTTAAPAWTSGFIELGLNLGPAVDIPSVQTASVSNLAANSSLTSISVPFSEADFPAVIVAVVTAGCYENAAPPVPPFTTGVSGLGLTWNLRGRANYNMGPQNSQEITVWWAHTTGPVSGTFQANFTGLSGSNNFFPIASVCIYAVMGVATPATPWDPNVSLPNFANPGAATISTSSQPDLLLGASIVTVANNVTNLAGALSWNYFQFSGASAGGGSVRSNVANEWSYQPNPVAAASVTGTGGSGATIFWLDAIGPGSASIVQAVGNTAGHATVSSSALIPAPAVGQVIGRAHVFGIAQPTKPQAPQYPFPTLQNQIKSYLYVWCNDDDNLQSMVAAYNAYTQAYLDWFNSIYLPIYTNGTISGTLLDWVATYLYGIPRPGLPEPGKPGVGPFNTYTLNSIPFNFGRPGTPGTFFVTSDDYYKRILTWLFYKGDGKVFNTRWLKRRIERFLNGQNGTDPGISTTYDISVQFTGPTEVTITISPTSEASAIFKAAADAGVLELPFQILWTITA